MSNATDYKSLLPKFQATPDKELMPIYIPIGGYVQCAYPHIYKKYVQ